MLLTLEVMLLALPLAIRPSSLAALYAMLSREAPRRLVVVYTVAGLAFTLAIGVIVAVALKGVDVGTSSSRGRALVTIAVGCVVLAFALALATGRIAWPPALARDRTSTRRAGNLLDRAVTPRTAALAGPATHLPGLFYLLALNLIAAHSPPVGRAVLDVLAFNAVWFLLPIAALAVCIVRPATARHGVAALHQWVTQHAREILIAVAAVVGTILVLRGLLAL